MGEFFMDKSFLGLGDEMGFGGLRKTKQPARGLTRLKHQAYH